MENIKNDQCRRCLEIGNKIQKNRRVCIKCLSKANRIRMKLADYNYYELNKEKVLLQHKEYYLLKKNSIEI
jgi:thymidine kinase